jgi:hypothetical protein
MWTLIELLKRSADTHSEEARGDLLIRISISASCSTGVYTHRLSRDQNCALQTPARHQAATCAPSGWIDRNDPSTPTSPLGKSPTPKNKGLSQPTAFKRSNSLCTRNQGKDPLLKKEFSYSSRLWLRHQGKCPRAKLLGPSLDFPPRQGRAGL